MGKELLQENIQLLMPNENKTGAPPKFPMNKILNAISGVVLIFFCGCKNNDVVQEAEFFSKLVGEDTHVDVLGEWFLVGHQKKISIPNLGGGNIEFISPLKMNILENGPEMIEVDYLFLITGLWYKNGIYQGAYFEFRKDGSNLELSYRTEKLGNYKYLATYERRDWALGSNGS